MLGPDVFMSDDAYQFYSSFCDVFGNTRNSFVHGMLITHGEKVLINILVMPKTK